MNKKLVLLVVVVLILFSGFYKLSKADSNTISLEKLEDLGSIQGDEMPLLSSKINDWKHNTKKLLEVNYGIPIVNIIENDSEIIFNFDQDASKDINKIYPKKISYTKSNQADDTTLANYAARSFRQTKYIETASSFSGIDFPKKGLLNRLPKDENVYKQTATTARAGYVLDDSNIWQPTYIIHALSYYNYTQGRFYYRKKPAVPYSTDNMLYDTYAYPNYYSTPAKYQANALDYFNKNQIYINGSIYK